MRKYQEDIKDIVRCHYMQQPIMLDEELLLGKGCKGKRCCL